MHLRRSRLGPAPARPRPQLVGTPTVSAWGGAPVVPIRSAVDVALDVVAPAAVTDPRHPTSPASPPRRDAHTAAAATVSTATALTPHKSMVLGLGSRGEPVRALQRALGGIAVDGVLGPVTVAKVVALQQVSGLPATGVVTGPTWDVLEQRVHPFLSRRTTVLRPGDSGPVVVQVQRLLGLSASGLYDDETREAVRRAQARAGLAGTGVVASRTWSLFDRLSA